MPSIKLLYGLCYSGLVMQVSHRRHLLCTRCPHRSTCCRLLVRPAELAAVPPAAWRAAAATGQQGSLLGTAHSLRDICSNLAHKSCPTASELVPSAMGVTACL